MSWDYEKIVRDLQDTMTVVVGIQARQASLLKDQSEWLESLQKGQIVHEKRMTHIDETLLEIGDKLNGLIGYMDNQNRPHGN